MQRTGTTSLARGLMQLKIVTRDHPKELMGDIQHPVIEAHQAFTDNPIPFLYRELDALHPGSRFIHTERDEAAWIKSVEWLHSAGRVKFNWHLIPEIDAINMRLYKRLDFDKEVFLAAYREHNAGVREHFKERPEDLLILDITRGEGFEKICPFLGIEIPAEDFPHWNTGTTPENPGATQSRGLGSRLKRAVRRLLG